MNEHNIEAAALMVLLRCDEESGRLYWMPRPSDEFSNVRFSRIWNSRYANMEAFTTTNGDGYKTGAIRGRKYQAHRVIWAMHYGRWPFEQIDHINHDRADNRINNLRDVSHAENARNRPCHPNNKSGHTGVVWRQDGGWQAQIGVGGNMHYLGTFADKEVAVAVRKEAEFRYGFHKNHGL